jgi:hypothetical protein
MGRFCVVGLVARDRFHKSQPHHRCEKARIEAVPTLPARIEAVPTLPARIEAVPTLPVLFQRSCSGT